jgi:hypothetical protein
VLIAPSVVTADGKVVLWKLKFISVVCALIFVENKNDSKHIAQKDLLTKDMSLIV